MYNFSTSARLERPRQLTPHLVVRCVTTIGAANLA